MNSRGDIDYEKAFQSARFIEHQFKDSRIFKAASEYILSQKETVNGNFQSKYSAIKLRKWVIKMFFGNKLVEEINRKCMLLDIEKNEKKSGFHLRFMWGFLFYLKDVGLLSPEWNKFEQMRVPLCAGREHNFSKALLSVEDSSRYYLFTLGKRTRLYYLDSGYPEIRNLMIDYLNKWDYIPENRDNILSLLFESHGIYLQSIKDINYSVFCRQIEILGVLSDCIKYMEQLVDFYRFIFSNYNSDLFSETGEFDPRILLRRDLGVKLAQGYRIVTYNPLAACPDGDLWIASFYLSSEQYTRHTTLTEKIDFSVVKSTRYRDYLKKYMWTFPTSWSTKSATKLSIITFLNYIADIKSGQILTIFSKPTTDEDFHSAEMAAYRQYIINKYPNIKTQSHQINEVSRFLKHLSDSKLLTLEKGVLLHLRIKADSHTDKMPISDNDLKKIADVMHSYAKESIKYALYYSVFYLALETEFRLRQLINLEMDCILETLRRGQYVILSKTKTSHGEYKEQAITQYTKKYLDEIRELTESFRQSCSDMRVRRLLFLEPYRESENRYRPLSAAAFNKHLQKCCTETGVRPYTFSNLRDTHMTKAEEYIIRKGLSDMHLRILTDHKSPETTRRHYSQLTLTEMLEAVHGIIIGDVNLEGTVLCTSTVSTMETETVSNGCGYCNTPVCTINSCLDCLMCTHFVTTPKRIPYFEEQLRALDLKIRNSSIVHDREDLVKIKRLLAAYLRELLIIKGDSHYAADH